MLATYLKNMRAFTATHRFRGWLLSALFGVIIISTFYALRQIVPRDMSYYNELSTALFIIISVLLLFPARERIARRFLHKTEYNFFFGQDFHHLDFIARQFNVDALINEITPELLEWLRVRTGKLVILDTGRRYFNSYIYRNGTSFKGRPIHYETMEESIKFLKEHRRTVYHDQAVLPDNVKTMMTELRASVLQPFIYRNRLLGFLVLHEEPRNNYAGIGLETYAGKAAISIQNRILFTRVIDAQLYDQELQSAAKIQHFLQLTRPPRIPGNRVKFLRNHDFPCIMEFFEPGKDRWFLTILCTPSPSRAAAMFLFGILGRLYSFFRREKSISINRLLGHLRKDPGLIRSEYRMDILIAEIRPRENRMIVMSDGKEFRIHDASRPERNMITTGWRNFLNLDVGNRLRIVYGREPLLEIIPGEEDKREKVPMRPSGSFWQLN